MKEQHGCRIVEQNVVDLILLSAVFYTWSRNGRPCHKWARTKINLRQTL